MNHSDYLAFAALFREAHLKCFGQPLEDTLTETESKLLSTQVLDQTGLTIGWKSIKNYSFFVVDPDTVRPENPSTATLDTLARYVLRAPYSSEIKRKNDESYYPYWFLYKEQFNRSIKNSPKKRWVTGFLIFGGGILIIILLMIYFNYIRTKGAAEFSDNFKQIDDHTLSFRGWFIKDQDKAYWGKRSETPGALSLYTLKGDNWPDPANKPGIKNLLLRKIPYDCFTAEVHLDNFIPKQEWQQAGILLLEDTTFSGKSIRLSVAYNDYFGGYPGSREILIQAITSLGNGFGKPEEIAHKPVLYPDTLIHNPSLIKNLDHSALRIEKEGKKFRFLYSVGVNENGPFKEISSQEFDMQPKYIGIFAIKGFKDSSAVIPAHFTFFRIAANNCDK
jgi:hypothetical protein